MPAVNSQASRRMEWGSGSLKLWLTPRKKSRTVLTDKQWRAVYERKKSEQEPFVCVCMWVKDVCVCVSARQVCWLTLIGRRAQQECARLQRSAGQVQTALSSHERVIVTGKSLHDQREPGPGQICTTLKIIPVFFWRGWVFFYNCKGMMDRETDHDRRGRTVDTHRIGNVLRGSDTWGTLVLQVEDN